LDDAQCPGTFVDRMTLGDLRKSQAHDLPGDDGGRGVAHQFAV